MSGKKKRTEKYYQQGDVLLICTDPSNINIKDAKKIDNNILAFGKATGNSHAATGNCEVLEVNKNLFLNVFDDSAEIVHEEHKSLKIPSGVYAIEFVKEYDHFTEEARRVQD